MPDERDEAMEVRRRMDADINRARDDGGRLSALGRYEAILKIFTAARQKMDDLRSGYFERRSGEARQLVRQLMEFRVPKSATPTERLAIVAGYRDALDRVQAVAEHHGAPGMVDQLARADRIGDAQVMRACFAIAIEKRADDPFAREGKGNPSAWDQVIESYLARAPSEADSEALAELRRLTWQSRNARASEALTNSAIFSLPEPVELTHLPPRVDI